MFSCTVNECARHADLHDYPCHIISLVLGVVWFVGFLVGDFVLSPMAVG